jgi:prophage regulatory protein
MSDNQDRQVPTLPEKGLVRINTFVGPGKAIPVARSTWWAGVKSGRYSAPIKLGPRTTAWRVEDIRALIKNGVAVVAWLVLTGMF